MAATQAVAKGAPGIAARWTSSAKSGVGTALSPACRIWFTISHGILNEVYYPRVDHACTRDLGLIVCGPSGLFLRREASRGACRRAVCRWRAGLSPHQHGDRRHLPHRKANPCRSGTADRAAGDHVHRTEGTGRRLPCLCLAGAPPRQCRREQHGVDRRVQGTADAVCNRHRRRLAGACLVIAVGRPARQAMSGSPTAGSSSAPRAGSIPIVSAPKTATSRSPERSAFRATRQRLLLALAFGPSQQEAAYNARASLMAGFDAAAKSYVAGWRDWQQNLLPLDRKAGSGLNTYRISTAVLATHRPLGFPGPAVASLSIPWGFSKGDEDLGGYHLVWPRDLVETAGGFLAAGASRRRAADTRLSPHDPGGRRPLAPERVARTAPPTGTASRWTSAPFRYCWRTRFAARANSRATR